MLRELKIKNFAIVEDQTLCFTEGMSAFTGETGAGKSLLLDAITLLLGAKARSDLVRQGAASAEVEGVFDISSDPNKKNTAIELGFEIEAEDGNLLFVRRELSASDPKKNRIWIQGRSATRPQLQSLLGSWVEVSGQHEFLRLNREEYILKIVDDYGELHEDIKIFQNFAEKHKQSLSQLTLLLEKERSREERLDYLRFQIEEFEKANISEDLLEEEPNLASLRERLANLERIKKVCELAFLYLDGWDSEDSQTSLGICGQLQKIQNEFKSFQNLGSDFEKVIRKLEDLLTLTQEIKSDTSYLQSQLQADPEELEKAEEKLTQLKRLKRKYGLDTAGLLNLLNRAKEECLELAHSTERINELKNQVDELQGLMTAKADHLHQLRKSAASELEKLWQNAIGSLGMKEARIHLEVTKTDSLKTNGMSRIEALFSANPGIEPKNLGKVASGGELSRILLALKQLVAGHNEVNVYLFDEVDTGIGGETAQIVGQKLRHLSSHNQVLVVTHLAQIAASAHTQFRIVKKVKGGKTRTSIEALDETNRVEEISRMLGATTSQAATKLAQELLKRGQKKSTESGASHVSST